MKASLLAGCAAIALAGFCGSAAADTAPGKFDIKIGGDASFTAGHVSQSNDTNTNQTDFTNRFRLQVTPTAHADNGLEYGANLRIRAWNFNGFVDTDQAYIFVGGNFGRVEAGVTQGPNNQYGVTAPSGFGTGGVIGDWADGPSAFGGSGTWLTNQTTFLEPVFGGGYNNVTNSNWATRINYFTPRFFGQGGGDDAAPTGLMGMLSYAPQNVSVGTGVNRLSYSGTPAQDYCVSGAGAAPANTSLQGCAYSNVIEAGLRYDASFGGVSVAASFGYEHGDANPSSAGAAATKYNDLEAYQLGLQLGYAGFLVGASYLNAGTSGYVKANAAGFDPTSPGLSTTTRLYPSDQSAITAGISYETGPVVVGFNYAHGEDAGNLNAPGGRSADLYSVGATYTLAPGFTTSLEYLHSTTNNEARYGTAGNGTDPFGATSGKTAAPGALGTVGAGSGNADLILWKNVITF